MRIEGTALTPLPSKTLVAVSTPSTSFKANISIIVKPKTTTTIIAIISLLTLKLFRPIHVRNFSSLPDLKYQKAKGRREI